MVQIDEKYFKTPKKTTALKRSLIFVIGTVVTLVILGLLGGLAMQFGVTGDGIREHFRHLWFMWLIVRAALYFSIGYVLYYFIGQAKSETDETAYRKSFRAFVICIGTVEIVNLIQLIN